MFQVSRSVAQGIVTFILQCSARFGVQAGIAQEPLQWGGECSCVCQRLMMTTSLLSFWRLLKEEAAQRFADHNNRRWPI